MGGFFGNIQNAERTQLRFDKIYPNRKAMEDGLKNGDGVFVGRFVLIEYDDNVSARRLAYYDKVEYPKENIKYVLYTDSTYTIPYKLTDSNNKGYGIFPYDLFYVEHGLEVYYFRCTGEEDEDGNALFQFIYSDYDDLKVTDYELNYKVDKENYPRMPDHGYDSTIWRKALRQGKEIYQMIACLNSISPSFYVEEDAPSITPVAPHFSEISNNKNIYLHMPANWGFKIKEAETIDGKELSDLNVLYEYLEYNPETDIMEQKKWDYPGALYYNKDGFDSLFHSVDEKTKSEISLLPTGTSGKLYYNHNTGTHDSQIDLQELKMYLPEIGNSIAKVWDIVYGEGEKINQLQTKRNQDIAWNSTGGLRLVKPDPTSGGFTYSPKETETIAGCINSVHDLMGMIVEDNSNNRLTPEQASTGKIYYGAFKEDGKKGYYFKDIEYKLIPFSETDINPEEWVGGRQYQDLIGFESNKYYMYSDANFILDSGEAPQTNMSYYLLGEGLKVSLKEWNPVEEDPSNPESPGIITYYYYKTDDNDYIKDSSIYPDENKTYYKITDKIQMTHPNFDGGGPLILLWSPEDYVINKDFDPNLIDPGDLEAMKITAIGTGYFYWDDENKILVPLTKDSEFDQSISNSGNYFYIKQFAVAEGVDLEGNMSESLYFIGENKNLISFNKIADQPSLLDPYRATFLALEDNKYYTEFDLEADGIEGFKCFHPNEDGTWSVDKEAIYWVLYVEQMTDTDLEEEEEPDDGGETPPEGEEESEYVHFYKPGFYFFKSQAGDFTVSNSLAFDPDKEYWRITHPDETLVEWDNTNNKWLIDPIAAKFYEPNKYYYYSKHYQKDLIDTDIIMKTLEHPDVVLAETQEGKIYYLINEAYVVEDPSGNLAPGYVWDKDRTPPDDVILGIKEEIPVWTELTGFARTLNTINGLILHINQVFKFNDAITRDLDTVQGCLNKIKDVLKAFKRLNPEETIIIYDY